MKKQIINTGILTLVGVLSFALYLQAQSELPPNCSGTISTPCHTAKDIYLGCSSPGDCADYSESAGANMNSCDTTGTLNGHCINKPNIKCSWTDTWIYCDDTSVSQPASEPATPWTCQ